MTNWRTRNRVDETEKRNLIEGEYVSLETEREKGIECRKRKRDEGSWKKGRDERRRSGKNKYEIKKEYRMGRRGESGRGEFGRDKFERGGKGLEER